MKVKATTNNETLLSPQSLMYRGVKEQYVDVHMRDMPLALDRSFDKLKSAEGMCIVQPNPNTEKIIDTICRLNAYLVKYYLVKYEGHKHIQVTNMNMFVKFETDGLERLQNTDYLIMEFADLLVINHIIPKQVLTTIVSILLERIGAKKTTVIQFHSSDFQDTLIADKDNPFAKFILGCLDISTKIPL